MMSKSDLRTVMDRLPRLNYFGIGIYMPAHKTPQQRRQELDEGRTILSNSLEACNRACRWLAEVDKIKTINLGVRSYALKHLAEKDIGYVTNGAFIAAAVHCGFAYRVFDDSANVAFGMSKRSLKLIKERQNACGHNWAL